MPSSKELAKVRFNKLTKVRRCTEPPWLPTPRQRGGSSSKRGGSRGWRTRCRESRCNHCKYLFFANIFIVRHIEPPWLLMH